MDKRRLLLWFGMMNRTLTDISRYYSDVTICCSSHKPARFMYTAKLKTFCSSYACSVRRNSMNLKQPQVRKFFKITRNVKTGFKQGLRNTRIKLLILLARIGKQLTEVAAYLEPRNKIVGGRQRRIRYMKGMKCILNVQQSC